MSDADWAAFPVIGFLVGAYGTIIGAGGGFLFVPILLLLYRYPVEKAVGTSLFVVCLNAMSGTWVYARQKRIDYRSGLLFLAAGIPGAIGGAWIPRALSGRTMYLIFGGLLAALGAFLLAKPERKAAGAAAADVVEPPYFGRCTRTVVDVDGTKHVWSFNEIHGIVLSFVLGFVSSMLGIGGGIIHVPAMTYLFHFPAHLATATSHLILAFTALVGSGTHACLGDVQWTPALLLGAGAIVGAQLGGRIAPRISGKWVIRGLAIAVVVLAVRLLWMGVQ